MNNQSSKHKIRHPWLFVFLLITLACQTLVPNQQSSQPSSNYEENSGSIRPISLAQEESGDLTNESQVDEWIYSASAGENLQVQVIGEGITDAQLSILDPNGKVVGQDDDGAGGLNPVVSFSTVTSGNYVFQVSAIIHGRYRIAASEKNNSTVLPTEEISQLNTDKILLSENFDTQPSAWEDVESPSAEGTLSRKYINGRIQMRWDENIDDAGFRSTSAFKLYGEDAPIYTEPYEFELDISNAQNEIANSKGICFSLLFDILPDFSSWRRVEFCTNGTDFHAVHFSHYMDKDDTIHVLSSSTDNLPDIRDADISHGQTRRLGIRVEPDRYTFLIDGVPTQSIPSDGPIGGTIGFGLQGYYENTVENLYAEIDNIVVRQIEPAQTVALQTLSDENYAETLYEEDFSGSNVDWVENYHEEEPNGIRDGAYVFSYVASNQNGYIRRVEPEKGVVPNLTEPYEFSIEISDIKTDAPVWGVSVGGNVRNDISTWLGNTTGYLQYTLWSDNSYEFTGGIDGFDFNRSGLISKGASIADGGKHTIGIQLDNTSVGLVARLVLDGVVVAEQSKFGTLNPESLQPLVDEINGSVFFQTRVYPDFDNNPQWNFSARVESAQVRSIVPPKVSEGIGLGPLTQTFSLETGRLTFMYPDGWNLRYREPITDAYASNDNIFNIQLSNTSQGFSGSENELQVTIYEPVFVMEQTGMVDTRIAGLEEVLKAFAQQDGQSLDTVTSLQLGDKDAVIAYSQYDQGDEAWIAFRASDQAVDIVRVSMPTGQSDELLPTAIAMAKTIDYPTPSQEEGEAQQNLRDFLRIANEADVSTAVNSYMCSSEALLLQLGGLFFGSMGDSGNLGFNPIQDFGTGDYTIDDAGRYFEIVEESSAQSKIRVSGNLVVKYSDGSSQVVPQNSFYKVDFLNSLLSAELYRMEVENGRWVVCSGGF